MKKTYIILNWMSSYHKNQFTARVELKAQVRLVFWLGCQGFRQ